MQYDDDGSILYQIIVYLKKLEPGHMLKLIYHIRAKFPIKANIPVNKVYPYCNPEKVALSDPQEIIVKLEGRESGVGSWELSSRKRD